MTMTSVDENVQTLECPPPSPGAGWRCHSGKRHRRRVCGARASGVNGRPVALGRPLQAAVVGAESRFQVWPHL